MKVQRILHIGEIETARLGALKGKIESDESSHVGELNGSINAHAKSYGDIKFQETFYIVSMSIARVNIVSEQSPPAT